LSKRSGVNLRRCEVRLVTRFWFACFYRPFCNCFCFPTSCNQVDFDAQQLKACAGTSLSSAAFLAGEALHGSYDMWFSAASSKVEKSPKYISVLCSSSGFDCKEGSHTSCGRLWQNHGVLVPHRSPLLPEAVENLNNIPIVLKVQHQHVCDTKLPLIE
jgi:hypothetical protein